MEIRPSSFVSCFFWLVCCFLALNYSLLI